MDDSKKFATLREGLKPPPKAKFKPSLYEVHICGGKPQSCSNLLTDRECGELVDPTSCIPKCVIDGWLVEVLQDKKRIRVTYRPTPAARPLLNEEFRLCNCRITMFCGFRDRLEVTYKEDDVKAMLRELGVTYFYCVENPAGEYDGAWGSKYNDKGVLVEQERFWVLCSGEHQPLMTIDVPSGEEETSCVSSPDDDALTNYDGNIRCKVGDGKSWVAICQSNYTEASNYRTVALYIKNGVELSDIYDDVNKVLAAQGYPRLDVCFGMSAR